VLGGEDGRTLNPCLGSNVVEMELSTNPLAGLAVTRVGVPHAGRP
jgi:hypothetical protein